MIALGVLLLGGVGASLRFVADRLVDRHLGYRTVWVIAAVNLVGSALIAVVATASLHGSLAHPAATVLAAGLCGGFTTWSTACVDSVALWTERRWTAVLHSAGVLTAAILIAWGILATFA